MIQHGKWQCHIFSTFQLRPPPAFHGLHQYLAPPPPPPPLRQQFVFCYHAIISTQCEASTIRSPNQNCSHQSIISIANGIFLRKWWRNIIDVFCAHCHIGRFLWWLSRPHNISCVLCWHFWQFEWLLGCCVQKNAPIFIRICCFIVKIFYYATEILLNLIIQISVTSFGLSRVPFPRMTGVVKRCYSWCSAAPFDGTMWLAYSDSKNANASSEQNTCIHGT